MSPGVEIDQSTMVLTTTSQADFERKEIYKDYVNIIREQLEDGIVEPAPVAATWKEFYFPRKPLVELTAEITKLRIVYDASAKGHSLSTLPK